MVELNRIEPTKIHFILRILPVLWSFATCALLFDRRFEILDVFVRWARLPLVWVIVRDDVSTLLPSVLVIVLNIVLLAPWSDFVMTIV